ncbi:MAG: hypothetical protein RR482_09140 [Clostridia bacterium]
MKRLRRYTTFLLALLLSFTCALHAYAQAPDRPQPQLSAKKYSANENILVTWNSVPGADRYRVLISRYPYGYDNVVLRKIVSGNELSMKLPGGKYACNMVAMTNGGEDSDFSPRAYFTVSGNASSDVAGRLKTPHPYSNKSTYKAGEKIRFSWKKIPGASSYVLYISKSPFGARYMVLEKKLTGISYTLTLPRGKYAFNMIAHGAGESSLYSDRAYLTVE